MFYKILIFFVLSIVLLTSCEEVCINGNADLVTREYDLNSFSGIKFEMNGTIKLHRGEQKISVTTDKNIIDYFEFKIGGDNLLYIQGKGGSCFVPSDLAIDVFSDNFYILQAGGESNWLSEPINISPKITMNGTGTVSLTGISVKQELINNSSGLIELTKMPTINAVITLNGSGDIKVKVSQNATVKNRSIGDVYIYNISGELDVTIQNSGNIYYSGSPSKIISVIQGSGKIIKM
jgi:hypothetical protein